MLTETLELRVFQCVVKHASYSKAADELDLSPSGVSKIISRLETRLGARLVQRTTRKLSLTEAGAAFHIRTGQILEGLSEAEAEIQQTTLAPRGHLRVSAPVVFGELYLAPMLDALLECYPDLSIDLSLMDRFVDLVEDGIDLAIRIGSAPDKRLGSRRLCSNHRVMVASPEYLQRRGVPKDLEDLAQHDCVLFTGFNRPREWKLVGPEGRVCIDVSGRISTNNVQVLHTTAKLGLGITVGATLAVGEALLAHELERVLCNYEFETTGIYAVYPSTRQLPSKVRSTVEFLAEQFCDPPAWDRALSGNVVGF